MAVAADYAIAPVQAGTLDAGTAPAASSPQTLAGSPPADIATSPQTLAGSPPADIATSPARSEAPASSPAASDAHAIGPDPGKGFVRLPGHVLGALAKATVDDAAVELPSSSLHRAQQSMLSLTLVLKRDDEAGFERYLKDVYDPQSKNYHDFLSQRQITNRFGPSRAAYDSVAGYLRKNHLGLSKGSDNRLTLTARGTRAQVEHALSLRILDFRIADTRFYANAIDPALPTAIAKRVNSVAGLSNLAYPENIDAKQKQQFFNNYCAPLGNPITVIGMSLLSLIAWITIIELVPAEFCALAAQAKWNSPPTPPPPRVNHRAHNQPRHKGGGRKKTKESIEQRLTYAAAAKASADASSTTIDGTGQTIGLMEFDTFSASDITNYLTFIGADAAQINNLSSVPVNGGATPGANQSEVLLDIDTVMTIAPGAKVVVYNAPFGGGATSYESLFNAMINGGVTIISNSWASCENQLSLADAQGIDAVLQAAAASGITVLNGTGDTGSTCLDGSANTISVPADSPNATAVGGTSLTLGPGFTYGTESWWDGSAANPPTGQGGFGTSRFFARPSYQVGLNAGTMRSIPDVSVSADPAHGWAICQASDGGCPSGYLYGGTSMAAPQWAGFTALLNQRLGSNLGQLNPAIYPYAGTTAFHSAASMASDFAHVGLGSPNLDALSLQLEGATPGAADPAMSLVEHASTIVSGVQGFYYPVPADGAASGVVVVTLADGNGDTIAGKTVTLAANGGSSLISPSSAVTSSNGTATFTITDLVAESLTFTATDTSDGVGITQTASVVFGVPPAASGGISANPSTLAADGQTPATIVVTVKDSLNRPAPGKSITLADSGAHATITGPTAGITDANGQIQFTATDLVNETVTFTAVDQTDGNLAIPGSATVSYSGSTSTACGVGTVPVAGAGYAVTPYITGVPAAANLYYGGSNIGCPGANNPVFTSTGNVLTTDFYNGNIYQTALSGGAVSNTSILSTLVPALGGLVYGKDGSAYATDGNPDPNLGNGHAQIVQVDPATGAQLRVVASNLTCPAGLSVDPLSGDLFFDDDCTGAGTDNASIFRVIDPANTNASSPTSVVVYATLPATPNGGMAFAPNGTLYAVSGYYYVPDAPVEQISGTNSTTVTVAPVSGITSNYGLSLGAANADGSAQSLVVSSASGVLSLVPIANPSTATVLVSANAPGPGVTGPDGCMYTAGHDTIYKIANSTGGCTFAPTSPAPSVNLTPATVSPNPAQGGSQTFTATLHNVTALAGVPVYFFVAGANSQEQIAQTNAQGSAVFSYTAQQAGGDTIVATTTASGTSLTSNRVPLTWAAGKHVSFLSMNLGPQAGTVNQPVNVVASLSDMSANPVAPVAGQTVTFALGGSTCTATTSSAGTASCSITPTQSGTTTLTAGFAGSSQLIAATDSIGFNISAAPTPAPTVTLSVSPGTIAAGSSATLTWSSTNATGCTASGSWSGSEATSGTQTVTPSANGSYSYTLACTGAGGSGTATAILSATLVAVTVTAKSGGGAMSWYVLLALGLLVVLRFTGAGGFALASATRAAGARTSGGRDLIGVSILALTFACVLMLACVPSNPARADQSSTPVQTDATSDPYYVGIRVGGMPIRQNSAKIDQGLASLGFPDVTATSDTSGTAGTVFLGYEFTPHTALELGYTFRDSTTAHLSGTIPSSSKLTPLLQDTAELTRGYGNIVSLSYSGHFEVLPRFSLEPRLGGFFWATKAVAITLDDRIDTTHEGGGVTAGVTVAYRLWRGLELGASVDHFRGFPNNIATLYAGTLEWRFGP
jgi:hypothetical protein